MSKPPPKVDPLLAAGPPPGTRIRPPEAPKPRPKARAASSQATEASRSAPATPEGTSTTPSTISPPSPEPAEPVVAELVEAPGALVPAAPAPFGAPKLKKTRKEREMERIGQLETQIWASASRILQHALCAADVPDDGKRPEGWSDRKWRTARDARENRREIPGYVEFAARVVESFKRSEALKQRDGGGMPPALNGNITFYVNGDVNNTFSYPTVEQKDPE